VLLEAEHIGIEGKGFPLVVYEYAGQVDSDAAPFSMAGRLAVGNQPPQPLSESKHTAHIEASLCQVIRLGARWLEADAGFGWVV
jgi:hypothetical protein